MIPTSRGPLNSATNPSSFLTGIACQRGTGIGGTRFGRVCSKNLGMGPAAGAVDGMGGN